MFLLKTDKNKNIYFVNDSKILRQTFQFENFICFKET